MSSIAMHAEPPPINGRPKKDVVSSLSAKSAKS